MTKIIRLDTTKKIKRGPRQNSSASICDHKNVIVYTAYRNVRCSICGELLDPFDVLADMVKGYIPGEDRDKENGKKFMAEVKKRTKNKPEDVPESVK